MELKLSVNMNDLLMLIRQLSPEQKLMIKKEVEGEVNAINEHSKSNDLKELLVSGPTMTKEEEKNFEFMNKAFNEWEKKLYA